jgi:hypothetical protein
MYKPLLTDYLPEFVDALKTQLDADQERWGDTWKKRGLLYEGRSQEQRFFTWLSNIRDQHEEAGTPVPWLKVAGEALICWVRQEENSEEEFLDF